MDRVLVVEGSSVREFSEMAAARTYLRSLGGDIYGTCEEPAGPARATFAVCPPTREEELRDEDGWELVAPGELDD